MLSSRASAHRCSAYALLLTLLVVVLVATTTAQLVTSTTIEAVRVSRESNSLAHELAVDSMVSVVADKLRGEQSMAHDLDRFGYATVNFTLGDCRASCRVVDDGAKLDVAAFENDELLLQRKLKSLARVFNLAAVKFSTSPLPSGSDISGRRYVWFDQLFTDVEAGTLLRTSPTEDRAVWSDVLTCFGSGPVDVRRASEQLLAILLDDLDRSVARKIIRQRRNAGPLSVPQMLQGLDPRISEQAAARITWGLNRYALEIDTAVRGDHRRWFVVATFGGDNLELHYRGQVRW